MDSSEKTYIDSLGTLRDLISEIDQVYSCLTLSFRKLTPVLRKKSYNPEDKIILQELLHEVHQQLDLFGQLIRRGGAEKSFFSVELSRLKKEGKTFKDLLELIEAELTYFSHSLSVRERGLMHLNELVQLLDSVLRMGQLTDYDERLLTKLVIDLKNLAE